MVRKYGRGMGWHRESQRHSLARQGISTKKTNARYAKDDLVFGGVEFEPTTVSFDGEPSKDEIMKDVEEVFTNQVDAPVSEVKKEESKKEEKSVSPLEKLGVKAKEKIAQLKKPKNDVTSVARPEAEAQPCQPQEEELVHDPVDVPDDVREIQDELDRLESEGELTTSTGIFSFENVKDKVKDLFHNALDSIKADSIEGFEKNIALLEEQKVNMEDRVHLLNSLKNKIQELDYKKHGGTREKLDDISRINNFLAKPDQNIKLIDGTVADLNARKKILIDERTERRREWVANQKRIRKLEQEDRLRGFFG